MNLNLLKTSILILLLSVCACKEQVKTNRFWMSNLLNLDQEDRDPSYILDYEKRVNALTAEAIQKIAQEYLDENYFLAILMPEEK